MRHLSCVISFALLLATAPTGAQEANFREILSRLAPQDAAESLQSFQLRPGFRIELVCAEPLVSDPIAIDWGPDGRLWVVEMGDYPGDSVGGDQLSQPSTACEGRGRIRFLEDTNQDGTYDRSTVFLDGLEFPTGVLVWKQGVLITCAPHILYAVDDDGDGKADRQEPLFKGFVQGNPQHCVNGLRWGLDNWLHGANGDNGGIISSYKTGGQVDIHGRDFRLQPDSGNLETETGMSQYGRCRDDWGNWFGGRNLQPAWHCVLNDHYLRRNPYMVPPNPCVDVMDPPTCPPVFPISTDLPRFNEFWTHNRFTSACGITIFRDNWWGAGFYGNLFICEPTYNLVHRSLLRPHGVTFAAERAPDEQQTEFLASTDNWFRPVQTRTGPDGALWIVDMYRLVIEHPDFIPPRWHDQLDFGAGRGRGRIYRVLPKDVPTRHIQTFATMSTRQLVQAIGHPNGVQRDMAQRLLFERQDLTAVEPLRQLAWNGPTPQSRVSALCSLAGLGAVNESALLKALEDDHASVRRHALRLAESLFMGSTALQTAVLAHVRDSDPQVRMQLAYSLGLWSQPSAGTALAEIALIGADDPFTMAAVMSSATRHADTMLTRILEVESPSEAQVALLHNLFRLVLEADNLSALTIGLNRLSRFPSEHCESWRYSCLASLLDALANRGQTISQFAALAPAELAQEIAGTEPLFRQAERDVFDSARDIPCRVAALRLMGRGPVSHGVDAILLAELLTPQLPVDVQIAAVTALTRLQPPDLPAVLLTQWVQYSPALRPYVVDTLLRKPAGAIALLGSIASGEISANELGAVNRNRLVLHNSADVRRMAAQLLRVNSPDERREVIDRFQSRLQMPADIVRGRQVFLQHCASCHRLENEGTNIGPDLLALSDRSAETLLIAILDPNRAVEPRYVEYAVTTQRGHVLAGIVTQETGNSLTLVDAQGLEHQLVRADVAELISTGKSLMPHGVEMLLPQQDDLLDLIAYLRSVEQDPAMNRPQAVILEPTRQP